MNAFFARVATALPLAFLAVPGAAAEPPNPRIDADAYIASAIAAMAHRREHRVSEADFQRMAAEPGTVILDARSPEAYRALHVAGAVNLPFPDITADSLARLIPGKATRVLIYCNNNFANRERAFPTKAPQASLNLSTFGALYAYGYRNVFELAPFLDADATRLRLVSGP